MRRTAVLQDALARQVPGDLADQGVDEGQLLAALALGREGHRVGHRDRELAREAGQVLEVVVGEGRRARPRDAVSTPKSAGRCARGRSRSGARRSCARAGCRRTKFGCPLHVVDQHGHAVAGHAPGDALARGGTAGRVGLPAGSAAQAANMRSSRPRASSSRKTEVWSARISRPASSVPFAKSCCRSRNADVSSPRS